MLDDKARAERCARIMLAADAASRALGLELEAAGAGQAVMGLSVGARHINGHGVCHGGVIFNLADTAFAVASNSRNQNSLAQHAMISYLAPGRKGDRLTAVAREVSLIGRSGIYDVTVTNQDDEVIAEFRGFSRTIKGQLFDEDKTEGNP